MRYNDISSRQLVNHDLLFTEASNFGNYLSIRDVKNEILHPPWYAFQASIESIRVMSLLPQAVVSAAIEHLLPFTQAVFNVLKKPVLDDVDLDANREHINAEYNRIASRFFEGKGKVQEMLANDLVRYNKFNLVNSSLTRGGFFALLEAQVIGVWAAFDVLTTDICVAVINAKPELLNKLGDRQIRLEELLKSMAGHNWTGRIGELVKVFVRFDSFKGTKDAYKAIFSDKSVDAALASPKASTACLIRTQITHDAGLATVNFLKQAKHKSLDPWKRCKVGDRLPLDGINVAQLSDGIIDCANELIRAVDEWLHAPLRHPPN